MITEEEFNLLFENATQALNALGQAPTLYNMLVWAEDNQMLSLNEETIDTALSQIRLSLLQAEESDLQTRLADVQNQISDLTP